MGNYLALCTTGDMQAKESLLKQKRVLQIIKVDGKILEFTNPLTVRDLLVSYPNFYVGIFKEATQSLPLDHKLKIGKIYYLLPSLDHVNTIITTNNKKNVEDDAKIILYNGCKSDMVQQNYPGPIKTETKTTTIKVVITKEQLRQILSKQGRVEELVLGVVSNKKGLSFEGGFCSSSSSWFPKLESIPEGSDGVC